MFVLDLDEAILDRLGSLRGAEDCEFHGLFHSKAFLEPGGPSAHDVLHQAEERLSFFRGSVDAVLGFRGFPVNLIAAFIAHDLDLPGMRPASVLKCEHRYWSRLELKRAFELHPQEGGYPRFARIDWGGIDFAPLPPFEPPLLLKPVLLPVSPHGGEPVEVRVTRPEGFARALGRFDRLHRINPDLDFFLEEVDAPAELLEMRGEGCFAEEWVKGSHHRADAYFRDGELTVYGLIDTHWEPDGDGVRFEYPSRLDARRRRALERALIRVEETFGLEGGPFSVDFVFPERGRAGVPVVAGVTAGISPAFAGLYERVDGVSNYQVALDLALRRKPRIESGQGRTRCAARFLLHGPPGARAAEFPTLERVQELERSTGASIRLFFDSGFAVANRYIFGAVEVGGDSPEELAHVFRRVTEELAVRFHGEESRRAA